MEYDKELIGEFVIESKEHLCNIEEDFLEMERTCDKLDSQLVDKVFRAIHSIKGAAGFLGLRKINDLSHVMETILQMVRSGETKPVQKLVNALLAGVDSLNAMFDDISNSEKMDIQKVVDRLSSLLAKQVSPKARKEMQKAVMILDGAGAKSGFEVSEFILNGRPKTHGYLYILKYDLLEMQRKGGLSPVSLVKELLSMGEILAAKIDTSAKSLSEDLSAKPLFYEVLYSTVLDPELICQAARLPKERIARGFKDIEEVQADMKPASQETIADEEACMVVESKAKASQPEPVLEEQVKENSAEAKHKSSEHPDSIRINLSILDKLMTLAGELVLVRNQHLMRFSDTSDAASRGISQRLDIVTSELQETIMRTRMQPVGNVFGKLPRIVRDLSQKLGKKMDLELIGEEVELDKTILESLADPLTHIIRNSCDHGVESPEIRAKAGKPENGHISVKAFHEGGQINIEIRDDGKGINPERVKAKAIEMGLVTKEQLAQMSEKEIIRLVTRPGFSTAEKVTEVSGRGVGMDVVMSAIEKMGGTLDLVSSVGLGTAITMRLPLTLAIIPCLIVDVAGQRYAIPQVNLEELVCLYDDDIRKKIECENNQEVYRLRNRLLPMVRLTEAFARAKAFTPEIKCEITERHRLELERQAFEGKIRGSLTFAVVKVGPERFGLIVDNVLGTEEIVVKPMHSAMKSLKIYSGATVMGDGRCALILDIDGLAAHAGLDFGDSSKDDSREKSASAKAAEETQTVLIFKNGPDEQFAVPLPLIRRIERIQRKDIERVGEREFIPLDGIPTRLLRIDKVFKVSPCVDRDEMFLIIPKHCSKPFGILVSSLVDITNSPLDLNTDSVTEDGILGSSILRGHLTLYPDVYRMIERLEPELMSERKAKAGSVGKNKRILLVEDAVFFRQLVRGYLEAGGYEVETAVNGREGLELLEKGTFDLVVSDIEMPVMDGWEFVKALRADKRNLGLPVIALTALDAEKDVQKAKDAGFDKYQVKIERDALLETVAESLHAGNRAKNIQANA